MQEQCKEIRELLLGLSERLERGFQILSERMDNFETRLMNVERNVHKVQIDIFEIRDDISAIAAYADKNAEGIYNHEKRIRKIEHRFA